MTNVIKKDQFNRFKQALSRKKLTRLKCIMHLMYKLLSEKLLTNLSSTITPIVRLISVVQSSYVVSHHITSC